MKAKQNEMNRFIQSFIMKDIIKGSQTKTDEKSVLTIIKTIQIFFLEFKFVTKR